jgi:UrcA family protein
MIASATNFTRSLVGTAGTLLLAGLCIAGATAPAAAHTTLDVNGQGQQVAVISYADLDLGSPDGRAALEGRIRVAARKVCTDNSPDPRSGINTFVCVQQALKTGRHAVMAAAATARAAN